MCAKLFHSNIKFLRKISNLTQEKFSEKIGVQKPRYAKWEEGTSQPDIDLLNVLAKCHNISLDDLVNKDFLK